MDEIRIYYEALEQAEHYIRPIILDVIGEHQIAVKLVRRLKRADKRYFPGSSSILSGIYSLVIPDLLITAVSKNQEYPLIILEFSEAVTTEDHELQRSYGAIAAILARCFYVKVSGNKQGRVEFGGAEFNPFSLPSIFAEQLGYEGYILDEWVTNNENQSELIRNTTYFSCPPITPLLRDVFYSAITAFLISGDPADWFNNSMELLKNRDSYQEMLFRAQSAPNLQMLLQTWQERETRNRSVDSLRYFVRNKWVGAKINRFSHVMDPDRGIITFLSSIFSDERLIYGIYALSRQRNNDLRGSVLNINDLRNRLDIALAVDQGGLPSWLETGIKQYVANADSMEEVIDIHNLFAVNQERILNSRVVTTLAYFLDGIQLNHNGVLLTWNRTRLLDRQDNETFIEALRRKLGFINIVEPLSLQNSINITEDEVTYVIVHRLFQPNQFRIFSVSYPGAQGGSPILPTPEMGKKQSRTYLDVIVLPPENTESFDILLNENKGEFSSRKVSEDIEKLKQFQNNRNYKEALRQAMIRGQVLDRSGLLHSILIGVGFGITRSSQTQWNPGEIDFIFRVNNRRRWSVGIFRQVLLDLISSIEGDCNLPDCYEVIPIQNERVQQAQMILSD